MNYEEYLKSLTITNIKKIATHYNKFVNIEVGKKTKKELIQHLLKHTEYDIKTNNINLKKEYLNTKEVSKPKEVSKEVSKKETKPKEQSKTIQSKTIDETQIRIDRINKEFKDMSERAKKDITSKLYFLEKEWDKKSEQERKNELLNPRKDGYYMDYFWAKLKLPDKIIKWILKNDERLNMGNPNSDISTDKEILESYLKGKPISIHERQKKLYDKQNKEYGKYLEERQSEYEEKQKNKTKPKEPEQQDNKTTKNIIEANDMFIKVILQALKDSGYKFTQNRKKYETQLKEIVNKYIKPILNNIQLSKDYDYYLKELEKNDFILEHIKNTQKGQDFYPTPPKCVKVFEDSIKQQRTIFEPTAGLGFIINEVRKINPEAKITAMEYDDRFSQLIKVMNPDVLVNPDKNSNFLDYNPNNFNQDMIIINPPFTNGRDSRYYMDFLFHCLYLLNRDEAGVLTDLIFISPDIYELDANDKENLLKNKKVEPIFLLQDIIQSKLLSKNKLEQILKRYNITYTKKELNEIKKKGGEVNNLNERIEEVFGFTQGQLSGQCEEFAGTKTKANMYQIFGANHTSKSIIKKINLK